MNLKNNNQHGAWGTGRIIFLILVILLGIAIRTAHYKWDIYDSDEAIVGLMAMHILSGEKFPVFNYGYPKLGSLEAYITAVMFRLFGISILSHRMALLFLSAVYMAAMYFLAVRLFKSREVGFWTLCFILICPSYLCFWNLAGRAVYQESLTLGTLIFLFLHQAVWRNEKRALFFLAFGVLIGIAWWTGGLVLYYILPVAIFLFIKDKLILFRRNFWIMASGFFIGSIPFWLYQLQTSSESMLFYSPGQSSFSFQVITDLVRYGLPYILSIGPISMGEGFLCKLSLLMEVIFLAALFHLFWKYRKGFFSMMKLSIRGIEGPELIFCFVIVIALIFSFSRYSRGNYRVLLPIYTAIPMVFASLVVSLGKHRKYTAYLVAGIVLFFSLYSTLCYGIEAFRQGKSRGDRFGLPPVEGFAKYLIERGINRCYSGSYLALKLGMASKGKIICAAPYNYRYPPYEEILNAGRNPVFILHKWQVEIFIDAMKSLGSSFDMEEYGKFVILKDFRRPEENLHEFSPEGWKTAASRNESSSAFAYDRNISTKWSPERSQRAGEYFKLDLGKIKKARKIVIIIDSSNRTNFLRAFESPLGFDLELSVDGNKWEKIFHLPDYGAAGGIFWSDCRPFQKAFDGRIELFLPEDSECRYIKFVLTNNHPAYGWTINEIFVYGQEENQPDEENSLQQIFREETPHEKVLEFLTKHRIKKIYAGYWLSSWIYLASGKKIRCVAPYNMMKYPKVGNPDRVVDSWKDTAFAVEKENAASIEKALNSSGISYSREEIGKYRVYYDFKHGKSKCGVKLKPSGWKASTSNHGMDERNAFDGDLSTRWGTGAPQKPGMYYELDMGRSYILRGVSFALGKFWYDYARGYRAEVSDDGKSWKELEENGWCGKYYWSGTHLLRFHEAGINISCKPVKARFIRITLTGYTNRFDFSIAEIEIRVNGDLLYK